MGRFAGRTVVISGAARGMGANHARGFVAEGAFVVIGDVLDAEARALADELGERALSVSLDVTEEDAWRGAVSAAEQRFGPVDVLVNNAAIQGFATVEESDAAQWRHEINVNLVGQYLGIKAVVPSMRRAGGGAIINISSAGGMTGAARASAYIASKWAIRGLTRSVALELGHEGIRVNSVHPGYTRTPMTEDHLDSYSAQQFAVQRVGEPEDITRLVLFVASDECGFSTGAEFVADGGWLLGPAAPPAGT